MKRVTIILLGCLLLSGSAAWADPAGQKQAADFVRNFYDWYVPIALKPDLKEDSSNVAIVKRGALFDPPLLKALKEDAEAFYIGPWLAGIRERYGMDPVIKYFETACVTDNAAQTVLVPEAAA